VTPNIIGPLLHDNFIFATAQDTRER